MLEVACFCFFMCLHICIIVWYNCDFLFIEYYSLLEDIFHELSIRLLCGSYQESPEASKWSTEIGLVSVVPKNTTTVQFARIHEGNCVEALILLPSGMSFQRCLPPGCRVLAMNRTMIFTDVPTFLELLDTEDSVSLFPKEILSDTQENGINCFETGTARFGDTNDASLRPC